MKRALLMLCCAFICGNIGAQSTKEIEQAIRGRCEIDSKGNVSYAKIVEVPGKSKDRIYDILQIYLAYTYNDANEVLQVEDKPAGLLVGKGIYSNLLYDMGVWHVIRMDIKDERVRIITSLTEFYTPTAGIFAKETPSIKDVCPLNPSAKKQAFYTKLFYQADKSVTSQFDDIEKALKEEVSTVHENSDW